MILLPTQRCEALGIHHLDELILNTLRLQLRFLCPTKAGEVTAEGALTSLRRPVRLMLSRIKIIHTVELNSGSPSLRAERLRAMSPIFRPIIVFSATARRTSAGRSNPSLCIFSMNSPAVRFLGEAPPSFRITFVAMFSVRKLLPCQSFEAATTLL